MSIRIRIALLALIIATGAILTMSLGYRSATAEKREQEEQIARNAWTRQCSTVIHRLQRERGDSVGLLSRGMSEAGQRLPSDRQHSDQAIAELRSLPRSTPARLEMMGLDHDVETLPEVRRQIDNQSVDWLIAQESYTRLIGGTLNAMTVELKSGRGGYSLTLDAITELAMAREAMGMLRATILHAVLHQADMPADYPRVIVHASLFRHYIQQYRQLTGNSQRQAIQNIFASPAYQRVDATIRHIQASGRVDSRIDSSDWWQQATSVIDAFKEEEDMLYRALELDYEKRIAALNRQLLLYGGIALLLAVLIVTFSIRIILRIAQSLNDLAQVFHAVVDKGNFTVRSRETSGHDEFSVVSRQLNEFLDYTDSMLREKERLASTDSLTGVMNRRSFLKFANREITRAKRYGHPLALLFIDIDHFKHVNDAYGHTAGDEVLKTFTETLLKRIRSSDILARWGGEEFIILAAETDAVQARTFAESLRADVAATRFPAIGQLTCSLGVAIWQIGENFDAFCSRADGAVYQAKEQGRNCVILAQSSTESSTEAA